MTRPCRKGPICKVGYEVSDAPLLHERAENARRLGRPRAAYDIAEWVWKLVNSGERG